MFDTLYSILEKRASADAMAWLKDEAERQRTDFEQRPFYYAFSGVSRHFNKSTTARVDLDEAERAQLTAKFKDFTILRWDEFRIARVMLLLVLEQQDEAVFRSTLEALLNTADLREQAAIYSAFALFLPEGSAGEVMVMDRTTWLVGLARDGLRTNIVDVYDAIALDNPFPARAFFDEAWNQMVLKALFINRPLFRIVGLDERANLTLAEALSNLAHERWAAGRWVSPELWRPCASFLTETIVDDLTRVAATDEPGQQEAVALIVASDKDDLLEDLSDQVRTFLDDVENGSLSWKSLGQQVAASLG